MIGLQKKELTSVFFREGSDISHKKKTRGGDLRKGKGATISL